MIADRDNDPEWLAADLLAQAEHDTAAQAILMTDDAGLAAQVEAAVARQLAALPRGNIAGASWETFGAIIVAALARGGARRWPTASPPSTSRSPPRSPRSSPSASATPAPSSSAPTPRR